MATGEAQTELHPSSADAKALLAPLRGTRSDGPNHREMDTPDRQSADRDAHPEAPSVKPGPGGAYRVELRFASLDEALDLAGRVRTQVLQKAELWWTDVYRHERSLPLPRGSAGCAASVCTALGIV